MVINPCRDQSVSSVVEEPCLIGGARDEREERDGDGTAGNEDDAVQAVLEPVGLHRGVGWDASSDSSSR